MTPERRTSTLNNATSVVSLDTIGSFHLIGYQRFWDGSCHSVVVVRMHEEPQGVIFLHGIWRHIKEFGIEGQIPRISSPVKLEKRC